MKRRKVATAALVAVAATTLTAGIASAAWLRSGAGSGSAAATSLGAPGTPALNGTAGQTALPLQWTAAMALATGSIGYWVERAPFGGSSWSGACGSSVTQPLTSTNCTDSGLSAGSDYQYRVTSVYGNWRRASGTSGKLTTAAAATAPAAPGSATVSSGCVGWVRNGNTTTTISWTAVSGATGYKVYRSTSSTPSATDASTAVGSVTTTTQTYSTSGGGDWYFWVSATNSNGESAKTMAGQHVHITNGSSPTCGVVSN